MGEPLSSITIGIHGIDFQVTISNRSENDFLAIPRNSGLGIVAWRVRELGQVSTEIRQKQIEILVDGPDVALGETWLGRTVVATQISGGIDKMLSAEQE